MEDVLKKNLHHVWQNEFKDRVRQGIFIIGKALRMTAKELQMTEQQIANEISVYKIGEMLMSL